MLVPHPHSGPPGVPSGSVAFLGTAGGRFSLRLALTWSLALALFGRKKTEEPAPGGKPAASSNGAPVAGDAPEGAKSDVFQPSPEKAARFFAHAKTAHETSSYEYAMRNWLDGLRHDPTNQEAVQNFFKSAGAFLSQPKPKPSKETNALYKGRDPMERYLRGMLDWSLSPEDASRAVGAAEAASKFHGDAVDLGEITHWIAERAIGALLRDKKPRKDHAVRLLEACKKVGAYDLAVRAGEFAVRLDPSDSELATRVRNLSAQATMSRGGFEQGGDFRKNIRDADSQRRLEEEQRIVKTEDVKERVLKSAEDDYRQRPTDIPTINKYARALREMGGDENETKAIKLYLKAFEDTKQFRFREDAGDLRLRMAARALQKYRDKAEANPGDETAVSQAHQAELKYRQMEIDEFKLRVEQYPTDLSKKFELGSRLFEMARLKQTAGDPGGGGLFEEVIPLLQEAKSDPRTRSQASNYLGQSFAAIGWNDEAIDTFRGAIGQHDDPTNERGMELRYGLMLALKAKAFVDTGPAALTACEEAEKLASTIAIQQFNYKDIREQREALKKRLEELRRGG